MRKAKKGEDRAESSNVIDTAEVYFGIIAADAEHVMIQFKLHDFLRRFFSAQIDFPLIEFDFAPKGGESFAVEFNKAFAGGPVSVKIRSAENFAPFPFGKFLQDSRAFFACQGLSVESDAVFSYGEGSNLFAVSKVKVNFSAFDVGFAVKRFTNSCVWYIIITSKNKFNKIVRLNGLICIIDI